MKGQVVQHCPVCDAKYDVGIYVSGQRVKCRRCGNKFIVQRDDSNKPALAGAGAEGAERQAAAGRGPAAGGAVAARGRERLHVVVNARLVVKGLVSIRIRIYHPVQNLAAVKSIKYLVAVLWGQSIELGKFL